MSDKLYELQHRVSGSNDMVAASSFQEACELMGWLPGDVWCRQVFKSVWMSAGRDVAGEVPLGFELTRRERDMLSILAEKGVIRLSGSLTNEARAALLRWLVWEDLRDVV